MTSNYYLEYRFIPQLLDRYRKGEIPIQALVDMKWWEKLFHDNTMEVELEGLEIGIYDEDSNLVFMDKGRFIAYTFPPIVMPPEAKYGIIDIEKKEYYTLESDYSGGWAVGSQNMDAHLLLHWAEKELSLNEFIHDISAPRSVREEKKGCLSMILLILILITLYM